VVVQGNKCLRLLLHDPIENALLLLFGLALVQEAFDGLRLVQKSKFISGLLRDEALLFQRERGKVRHHAA
jgi:hypothetical protein